jgi:2-polyprenyl-3-methyl-5-hydroxy-6-metoxy-1,4-benzoquinol methylase
MQLAENSYGLVKRLEVVESWVIEVAKQLGKPRLEILDYGCGTGDHLTAPLAQLGHSVLGVDMHEESIADARRRTSLASLTFRAGELDDLLAERLSFDVVICSEVLEHVDDPATFLAKLRALTRADGAVIITTPNGRGSFEILCASAKVMKRLGLHQLLRWIVWRSRQGSAVLRGKPAPRRPLDQLTTNDDRGFLNVDSGHVQFFSVARLERLFTVAGLHVVARRARTLLCGPYVDAMFALCPWRTTLFRWNNRAADVMPFAAAADWMFLLRGPR